MKNISYVINSVFAVAVIALFCTSCNTNSQGTEGNTTSPNFSQGDSAKVLPIAYINLDSLLTHYTLYKDANDALMKKSNSANATLAAKQRQFETEVADFQKKIQNNAFLSEDRARQEQTRLQKMESELHALAQRLQEDYMKEQVKLNNQIADSVRLNLKEYNKTANYEMIFTNTGMDNILLAKDAYDITDKIAALLNSRYKPEPAK
ncbi:outer membrane protein [Dysgonomonas sp. PFB1-18]|uniref:OmpH family outer membrane protein n=1 Tax=unclassified Dysgonomonas TaxID=2630389 RepID=UPI00247669EC|nr:MULTISPECIES: OmpH family outer membrane protein [unclassified Dysgonomonas]MDH6308272.1 outer membrane protein [Dysgonomonas sp. PF1-14]MDH6338289.1 outer membrane protein [Dysgonomonas sp. PF1-16]MDH6379786.1 outer membrane protein [Dysgonomonas sp. PFB1-18]MDH6397124.1 outer membrane protein [Dysgonomonas sp. PF1-23]